MSNPSGSASQLTLDGVPVPEWHAQELDRRLAEPEDSKREWSNVRAELIAKYNLPQ